MPTVVFSLEGVLAQSADVGAAPIEHGLRLFHAIRTGFHPCVIVTALDLDKARHWLRIQGVGTDHFDLLLSTLPWETSPAEQVQRVQSMGHNIGLFVTSDLDAAKDTMKAGVCTLAFIHPVYLRPEHRPDWGGGIRAWADIESDVEHQKLMLIKDERLKQL